MTEQNLPPVICCGCDHRIKYNPENPSHRASCRQECFPNQKPKIPEGQEFTRSDAHNPEEPSSSKIDEVLPFALN